MLFIHRLSFRFLGLLVPACFAFAFAEETPTYLNSSLPVEQRIDDLLPQMTLDEKILQISDDWGSKGVARLKIPALLKTEGLHGQSYSTGATLFPDPICMAATFDPDLVGKIGKETGIECKADHIHSSWSPVLDVARDVRWGRVEETYGESPYLVSRMGVAWITGFQGEGMIAVPKHFAGHGEPRGGRDSNDVDLSDRTMRQIHLPSFRAAVEEAHAGGIMAAYSTWHGVPNNASTELLQGILRQEWGFDGYVVSDCGGPENFIHKHAIVKTPEEAAALAAAAGVNMECGSIYKSENGMAKALEDGLLTPAELDEVVRPILRAKFRLGLFEHPEPDRVNFDKLPEYDTPEARALAREVEVNGAVLLRNEKNILPLSKNAKTIAVIGPDADVAQTGDYSPKPGPDQLITVLQGIKSHVGPDTQVVFAPGLDSPLSKDTSKFADAVAAAKGADVAIVVVGDNCRDGGGKATTGENNDGATLDFPGAQRDLIKAVQATGTPVVLVIVNGKPFTLEWESENIPAILVTWYPGEEGGDATADLLFGDRNPSGRLPVTWPRSPGQLPLNYDYSPSGRRYDYYDMEGTPQYRFGFGLSYTKFRYSNLQITPKADDPGFVTVTADVQNVGDYDGDDVVQLYFTQLIASVSTPIVELGGFKRVSMKKGETKTVSFDLTPYQLSLLDVNMVRRVEPGTFRIHVGGVCPDVPTNIDADRKLKAGFYDPMDGVSGEFNEPKAYSARFSYSLDVPDKASGGQPIPATLTVRNDGNLTDVTMAKLYAGSELGDWSFELNPGETKTHLFRPTLYKPQELVMVAGTQLVAKTVNVEPAPARLDLSNVHTLVDGDDILHVTADAQNVGSDSYDGALAIKVDGQPAGEKQPLKLDPGEKKHVALNYPFNVSGLHQIQINNLPEQQIMVPGGIALALQNPLVYLKFGEGQGASVKNEITGKALNLRGAPTWVDGRNDGKALSLTSGATTIEAGNIDIYRKAFTLSAWVKITQFGNGNDIGLFGGQAPMGADQDNTGTLLHVGVEGKKLFMGFFGRDIKGDKDVPLGEWVNLTYTYDPKTMKGSLYLNGELDRMMDQKPYAGPLETIGGAPILDHGSYALQEAVVAQSCFDATMIHLLADKGFESLRTGEYTSSWRPFNTAQKLEVVSDIDSGSTLSVIVESGDKDGNVVGSRTIEIKPGQSTYSLAGLAVGSQIRARAEIACTDWDGAPILRAMILSGPGGEQRWATPNDWASGKATPGLITTYGQP
jgi:beta-glucosidase